jgi:hypothetical protein
MYNGSQGVIAQLVAHLNGIEGKNPRKLILTLV